MKNLKIEKKKNQNWRQKFCYWISKTYQTMELKVKTFTDTKH